MTLLIQLGDQKFRLKVGLSLKKLVIMIEIIDGYRKQTASEGMILTFEGQYSYEVYLGNGMPEWNEIPDTGQLGTNI